MKIFKYSSASVFHRMKAENQIYSIRGSVLRINLLEHLKKDHWLMQLRTFF